MVSVMTFSNQGFPFRRKITVQSEKSQVKPILCNNRGQAQNKGKWSKFNLPVLIRAKGPFRFEHRSLFTRHIGYCCIKIKI